MSEYIIDWDESLVIDTFSKNGLREGIVRCMDCKYVSREYRDFRFCYRLGEYREFYIEPDGFCAWGVRKEVN